jgi:hypothetical protein
MGANGCNQKNAPLEVAPATTEEVWKHWRTHLLAAAAIFVVVATTAFAVVACSSSTVNNERVTSLEKRVGELERRCQEAEDRSRKYMEERLANIIDGVRNV